MRAVIVRSLLVIGTGALVLGAVLYVASTVDARPPEVLGVQLTQPMADDPNRALITTSIEIAFSEPVEVDGAAASISLDPVVDGSASWSGSTMIFTPQEPLEIETEYSVTIGPGVRDLAGNEMTELPSPLYTFVTAGRPTLAQSDPADESVDVAVDAVIGLTFSTLMDTSSVETALEVSPPFAHDLRWSGERLEIVPRQALQPARDYTIRLRATAADVAGVAIDRETTIAFRTVAPGLGVSQLVPAGGSDGIVPTTPIAVVFDRPIDPDSVTEDVLEITPPVAGSFEVVGLPDEPAALHVLQFTPSAPLPRNTTFDVELVPGTRSDAGGGIAEPVRWSFTTGAPQATLSNQVLFLSDRSGVTNVWAMNPDGTGQRQVSAELTSILDYAAAPNGSSVVVGDGRRLVFLRADGSGREVLTEESFFEFDPAFAPDGSGIAFARADGQTGNGLGLWTWDVSGGAASRLDLPGEVRRAPTPDPSPGVSDDVGRIDLRAPRYAPDGQALAYVDLDGYVGIVELPAERLTRVEALVTAPPVWRPDSSGVLLMVHEGTPGTHTSFGPPVAPLSVAEQAGATRVALMHRSGTRLDETAFGDGARLGAIASAGRIAYLDADAMLRTTDAPDDEGTIPGRLEGVRVTEIAFGPGERSAVLVVESSSATGGVIERIDLGTGERVRLVRGGWHVRWLP